MKNNSLKYAESSKPAFNRTISSMAMRRGKAVSKADFSNFNGTRQPRSSKSSTRISNLSKQIIQQDEISKQELSDLPKIGSKEEKNDEATTKDTGTILTSMEEPKDEYLEESKELKIDEGEIEDFKIDVSLTQQRKSVADMRK